MSDTNLTNDRLVEIAAEYGDMVKDLGPMMVDGPGAASAFYMSCSLAEVHDMARECIERRQQFAESAKSSAEPVALPTPEQAASQLRQYAAKQRSLNGSCPPGDNIFEDAARILDGQAAEIARLREDLAQRDDLLIKAEKFRFSRDITVESRGPSQWAVCHTGEVLNASGEWEREPMPSSRTAEFIARTRFTFAEAVRRARAALQDGEAGNA